jgi:hypothetical protein
MACRSCPESSQARKGALVIFRADGIFGMREGGSQCHTALILVSAQ